MGNSQGKSNETEAAKTEKETATCCEIKRRKSKSAGVNSDDRTDEGVDITFENEGKTDGSELFTGGSNDDSTKLPKEGASSKDDKSESQLKRNVSETCRVKQESDISVEDAGENVDNNIITCSSSQSPERLCTSGENGTRNVNDAENDKSGTSAAKNKDGNCSEVNDGRNARLLQEAEYQQVGSNVTTQASDHALDVTNKTEKKIDEICGTHDNLSQAGIVMSEQLSSSAINEQHTPRHIASRCALENPAPTGINTDGHELGEKPSTTALMEENAHNITSSGLESDIIRTGVCGNSLGTREADFETSNNKIGKQNQDDINISRETFEDNGFSIVNSTSNDTVIEEEFVMVEAASNMSPGNLESILSQNAKMKQNEVTAIHDSTKYLDESSAGLSLEMYVNEAGESHTLQKETDVSTAESSTKEVSTRSIVDKNKTTGKEKQEHRQTSSGNVETKDIIKDNFRINDMSDNHLEKSSEHSEKQDNDSLKEFEETEYLCEAEIVAAKDAKEISDGFIKKRKDNDKSNTRSDKSEENDMSKRDAVSTTETPSEGDSIETQDSCSGKKDYTESCATKKKAFLGVPDRNGIQDKDLLKVTTNDQSEVEIVPPPTPSSMVALAEEEEGEEETDDGVTRGVINEAHILKGPELEFGDNVCKRLSQLLDSQSRQLAISEDDDIEGADDDQDVFFDSELNQDSMSKDERNIAQNNTNENIPKEADNKISSQKTFRRSDNANTMGLKDGLDKLKEEGHLNKEGSEKCDNELFRAETVSCSARKEGNKNDTVSFNKSISNSDTDIGALNKQDVTIKTPIQKVSKIGDLPTQGCKIIETKYIDEFSHEQVAVDEVMGALDEVIDEAYSQVFKSGEEKKRHELELEIVRTNEKDHIEHNQNTEVKGIDSCDAYMSEEERVQLVSDLKKTSIKDSKTDEILVETLIFERSCKPSESRPGDTKTKSPEKEPPLSLKIPTLEETLPIAIPDNQTVEEIQDRTPTTEACPMLTALTEMVSADVDNLVQYHPSGRQSVTFTESDLDISEQRDDLSTEGMYADDEDDETMEILFTRTYTEPSQGSEAFVSCTVVNSAYRQAGHGDSFLQFPDTFDLLESSSEVMSTTFIKAKKEMKDIHVHLQSLRKQMEHFHDDVEGTSLPDLDYLSPDPLPRRAITD